MLKHILQISLAVLCLMHTAGNTYAQSVKEPRTTDPNWTKPYPAFRIAGNLYYVGTYELGCYLITSSQGHILINTGIASSASLIKANIESLGFKLSDVKILLTTQAHHDHNGAMAAIKKMTGAKFMVNEKDAEVLRSGASPISLFNLLSKEFLVLVLIAMVVACPIAWLAMAKWLQNYEYRVPVSWWIFVIAGVLAVLIALFTVSFQAINAAIANPVKSLRTE